MGAAGRRCPERLALVLGLCSWAAALRGKRGPPLKPPARPRGAAGNFGTGRDTGGVPTGCSEGRPGHRQRPGLGACGGAWAPGGGRRAGGSPLCVPLQPGERLK